VITVSKHKIGDLSFGRCLIFFASDVNLRAAYKCQTSVKHFPQDWTKVASGFRIVKDHNTEAPEAYEHATKIEAKTPFVRVLPHDAGYTVTFGFDNHLLNPDTSTRTNDGTDGFGKISWRLVSTQHHGDVVANNLTVKDHERRTYVNNSAAALSNGSCEINREGRAVSVTVNTSFGSQQMLLQQGMASGNNELELTLASLTSGGTLVPTGHVWCGHPPLSPHASNARGKNARQRKEISAMEYTSKPTHHATGNTRLKMVKW
jgi:hypothetical protein